MNTIHLEVHGMSCSGCVKRVSETLQRLAGVTRVDVDLAAGQVAVYGDFPRGGDVLVQALTAAGYPAKPGTSPNPTLASKKSGGCCG